MIDAIIWTLAVSGLVLVVLPIVAFLIGRYVTRGYLSAKEQDKCEKHNDDVEM